MKSFTYLGLEFTPEATLKGKETSFYNISKRISNLKDTPYGWDYDEFYKVAKQLQLNRTGTRRVQLPPLFQTLNYYFLT